MTSVAWIVILETTQMFINRGLVKTKQNKQTNKNVVLFILWNTVRQVQRIK